MLLRKTAGGEVKHHKEAGWKHTQSGFFQAMDGLVRLDAAQTGIFQVWRACVDEKAGYTAPAVPVRTGVSA